MMDHLILPIRLVLLFAIYLQNRNLSRLYFADFYALYKLFLVHKADIEPQVYAYI